MKGKCPQTVDRWCFCLLRSSKFQHNPNFTVKNGICEGCDGDLCVQLGASGTREECARDKFLSSLKSKDNIILLCNNYVV